MATMHCVQILAAPSPQPSPRGRGSKCARLFALFISSFILHPSASSQTTQPTLKAEIGFGGVFKPDSWTPIFVSVADPISRPGTIEVQTARGRVGNVISARMQSNAKPTTFSLYAPLDPLDRATIDWRDEHGKQIAHLDLTDKARQNAAALGGAVFGSAGQIADANRVATQLIRDTGEYIAAGAISNRLLPERAIAYQSLDVLVLPELDTDAIDDATENEIVNWVRAGGMVVTWPGTQATPDDSPLAKVLPVSMGDVHTRTIEGKEVAVRDLRPIDSSAVDLSDSRTVLFARNVGLGQVAVFGFDPTLVYRSIDDRIEAIRKATGSQVQMLPGERRVGSYDPLVFQARGEEQLEPAEVHHDTWLWIALGFGLVMGPAEALLLLLCRRPILTPLTMTGVAVALGSGVALAVKPDSTPQRTIEVIVETDEGVVARSVLSTRADETAAASWIIGRSADPLHETSGELAMHQRQDRFEPAEVRALSDRLPRIRAINFGPSKSMLLVSESIASARAQVQSADEKQWDKAVVLSQDQLRVLSKSVLPSQAIVIQSNAQAPTASDDSATARRETSLEALAKQSGWEPILMDRHLGSRIVRIFESEPVNAIVAQRTVGNTKQFVIHIQRP